MTITAPNDLSALADAPPAPEPSATDRLLTYYGQTQRMEGCTGRTIREREYALRDLERTTGTPLAQIQRQDIILFMAGKDWAQRTRSVRRSMFRSFYTWMQDEGLRDDNPAARLPSVRVHHRTPTPFTPAEVQQLLDAGLYSKTLLKVLLHYYLGLRVHEIAKLHGQDIDWTNRKVTVLGKGSKEVTLPIPAGLWPHLEDQPRDAYWFPNLQRNRDFEPGQGHVSGKSVSETINDAIRRAGLKHRAHDLRAATATAMHRAGVSAYTIQQSMRHTNAETTNRYLLIDEEQIRAGLDTLPAMDVPTTSRRRPREAP